MENSQSNKVRSVVFPEETGKILGEIIKKYGLKETEEKILKEFKEKLDKAKTSQERIKAITKEDLQRLPDRKIIITTRGVARGKITKKDFASTLQKQLDISKKKAEKMAEDLEKEILTKTKEIITEEEVPEKPAVKKPSVSPPSAPPKEPSVAKKPSVTKKKPPIKKPEKTPKKTKKPTEETKKQKKAKKQDVYREPIE